MNCDNGWQRYTGVIRVYRYFGQRFTIVKIRIQLPVICLLTCLIGCAGEDSSESPGVELSENAILAVEITELALQTVVPEIVTTGSVRAVDEVMLSAEVSGPVAAIHVREGQSVARGDLLLELNDERLQHEVTRAQQLLRQSESRAGESFANLQRRRELAAQDTLSEETLAAAEHEAERASAMVEEARAALALAQRNLRESRLISPVDGVIDRRMVDTGETIQVGQSLISIQATGQLEVRTFVSERDIQHIAAGATAVIELPTLPDRRFTARVTTAGIAADPRTGNFPVRVILEERDERLRPGLTARVTILGQAREILLLPPRSLVDVERRQSVYLVEDGLARIRHPDVIVGPGNRFEVVRGLSPGDKLIVSNQHRLIDGAEVEITARKAAPQS